MLWAKNSAEFETTPNRAHVKQHGFHVMQSCPVFLGMKDTPGGDEFEGNI